LTLNTVSKSFFKNHSIHSWLTSNWNFNDVRFKECHILLLSCFNISLKLTRSLYWPICWPHIFSLLFYVSTMTKFVSFLLFDSFWVRIIFSIVFFCRLDCETLQNIRNLIRSTNPELIQSISTEENCFGTFSSWMVQESKRLLKLHFSITFNFENLY
jgi:hypothetical protein